MFDGIDKYLVKGIWGLFNSMWVGVIFIFKLKIFILKLIMKNNISSLIENLNFSFDATLVMYINKTINPPTIIINKI